MQVGVFNCPLVIANIYICILITPVIVSGGDLEKSTACDVVKSSANPPLVIFRSSGNDSTAVDDVPAANYAGDTNENAVVAQRTAASAATMRAIDLLSTSSTHNSTAPTTGRVAVAAMSQKSLSLLPQRSRTTLVARRSARILARPKRYLAFPEGSSFSVAVCFTVGIIGNPRYNYMSFGLNWGVAYDLPNTSWILNHLHGFSRYPVPPSMLGRRTRRSLYNEIATAVDNMGYNGRDCVLRALCESRQYFTSTKMGMIGEILRVVFSLPKQRLFTRELHENSDIEVYDHAYRRARSVNCVERYSCSFSLLELALGKYSTPPPGYYDHH